MAEYSPTPERLSLIAGLIDDLLAAAAGPPPDLLLTSDMLKQANMVGKFVGLCLAVEDRDVVTPDILGPEVTTEGWPFEVHVQLVALREILAAVAARWSLVIEVGRPFEVRGVAESVGIYPSGRKWGERPAEPINPVVLVAPLGLARREWEGLSFAAEMFRRAEPPPTRGRYADMVLAKSRGQAEAQAALLGFMAGRERATFADIADIVWGDPFREARQITKLIARTNESLAELGIADRLEHVGEAAFWAGKP